MALFWRSPTGILSEHTSQDGSVEEVISPVDGKKLEPL